ncbi:MAG: sugar ABC transporter permease [Clostridia bacterium]|nr:sugar ABC transporter permease [Clostridia bacterium]
MEEKARLFDGTKKRSGMASMRRREDIQGTLMSILPFVGFLAFSLYPMLLSLVVSFHELKSYDISYMKWVGLENYKFVFTNKWVNISFKNTIAYCLSVPINIVVSLFLANICSKPLKGTSFVAVIAYMPSVCSTVGVTLMWQWIFEPNYGVINTILGYLGVKPINFMGDVDWFMPSVLTISVWMKATNILQLQGAMANVDQSLKEAAKIDGANGFQIFYKVVLPGISPTLFYVTITWLVAALQEMAIMQLITNSGVGPGFKAMTVTYYIYRMGIQNNAIEGFGRASALSWIFAIVIMIISKLLFKLSDKVVTYD